VTRGKVHDYLGMTIDYSNKGKVKYTMYDYIYDFLEELPPEMRGTAPSPVAGHLFEINTEDPVLLGAIEQELFHHHVAQLLYLSKRARPDIQLPIAFLCTRVQAPCNLNVSPFEGLNPSRAQHITKQNLQRTRE